MNLTKTITSIVLITTCLSPVITRSQTQPELNRQAKNAFQAADADLNRTYQLILEQYQNDPAFLKNLRAAQKLWIQFRDAELKMRYPDREPGFYGSAHEMCLNQFLEKLTRARIATLQLWLTGLPEGDVCCGSVKVAEKGESTVPEATISPDKRLGVTVPRGFDYPELNGNSIVDIATGKEIATIHATTGAEQQNHGGNSAAWTGDSRYLLWTVEGKWFPRSVVLIQLGNNGVVREMDVLAVCQKEMLRRTEALHPREYLATKGNEDMGPGYPDGFTIDLDYDREELAFPLEIKLNLTNDPKYMAESSPEYAGRLLEGSMTVEIDEDFNIAYPDFQLRAGKAAMAARNQ